MNNLLHVDPENVGVHWNFQEKKLSVRPINYKTGELYKRILTYTDKVALIDADFTVNKERLLKWRDGNKYGRQFAEVRGKPADAFRKNIEDLTRVHFNPRVCSSFYVESDKGEPTPVERANYVEIRGCQILAELRQ